MADDASFALTCGGTSTDFNAGLRGGRGCPADADALTCCKRIGWMSCDGNGEFRADSMFNRGGNREWCFSACECERTMQEPIPSELQPQEAAPAAPAGATQPQTGGGDGLEAGSGINGWVDGIRGYGLSEPECEGCGEAHFD